MLRYSNFYNMAHVDIDYDKLRIALKRIYESRSDQWTIYRILDEERMKLCDCYINLSIVSQKEQHKTERITLDNLQITRVESYEALFERNVDFIKLENIFLEITAPEENNRILITGRAGIGKSTLCRKITYEFYQRKLWDKKFDMLLWINLRELLIYAGKVNTCKQLEHMIIEDHFQKATEGEIQHLKTKLFYEGSKSKTLFLLDGLDEVASCFSDRCTHLKDFVYLLVGQRNIIITSRPYTANIIPDEFDLKLETVGFNHKNVMKYIKVKFPNDGKKVEDIQSYILENPVILGLVNIPIQLNILCYCWKGIDKSLPLTMTKLFEAIMNKLWLASKTRFTNGKLGTREKDLLLDYIGLLAFEMLQGENTDAIEFKSSFLNDVTEKFRCTRSEQLENLNFDFETTIMESFFIHTPDYQLPANQRRYHFIHLTFQDYFAANYIAKSFMENCMNFDQLIIKNKYNPRYEILWQFVAGILNLKQRFLNKFFNLLEQDPIDIVGSYHHLLVTGCANECNLPPKREDRLFCEYFEHMRYELDSFSDTWLTKRQMPNNLIQRILDLLTNQQKYYSVPWTATVFRSINLPIDFLLKTIDLLFHENIVIKKRAMIILSFRSLPIKAVKHLIFHLQRHTLFPDIYYHRYDFFWPKKLPTRIFDSLIDLLIDHSNTKNEKFASEILYQQRHLSTESAAKLIGMLQLTNGVTKLACYAAEILWRQKQFDDQSFQMLFAMLKSGNTMVGKVLKEYAEDKNRFSLKHIEQINSLLEHEEFDAYEALKQSYLPEEIIRKLSQLAENSPNTTCGMRSIKILKVFNDESKYVSDRPDLRAQKHMQDKMRIIRERVQKNVYHHHDNASELSQALIGLIDPGNLEHLDVVLSTVVNLKNIIDEPIDGVFVSAMNFSNGAARDALRTQVNIRDANFEQSMSKLTSDLEPGSTLSDEQMSKLINCMSSFLQKNPVKSLLQKFDEFQGVIDLKFFLKELLRSQKYPTRLRAIYFMEGKHDEDKICFYNGSDVDAYCIHKKRTFYKALREAQHELQFPEPIDVITRFLLFHEPASRKDCLENVIFDNILKGNQGQSANYSPHKIKKDFQKRFLKFEFFKTNANDKCWSLSMSSWLRMNLGGFLNDPLWIHIDLSANYLTDDQLAIILPILEENGKFICSLNLSHNMLTAKFFAEFLTAIAKCPKLKYVFLGFNHIQLQDAFCNVLFETVLDPDPPLINLLHTLDGIDLSMNFIESRFLKKVKDDNNTVSYYARAAEAETTIEQPGILYSVFLNENVHSLLNLLKSHRGDPVIINKDFGSVTLVEYKSNSTFIRFSKHQFIVIEQVNASVGQLELIRAELVKEDSRRIRISIKAEYPNTLFAKTNNLQNVISDTARCSMALIQELRSKLDDSKDRSQFSRYSIFPRRPGVYNCGTWAAEMLKAVKIDVNWSLFQER